MSTKHPMNFGSDGFERRRRKKKKATYDFLAIFQGETSGGIKVAF